MIELVFVYNADSGKANALKDSLHKILSPSTYPCSLCELTHHALGERKAWRNFRQSQGVNMEFLHRDEFVKTCSKQFSFPVVVNKSDAMSVLISSSQLDAMTSLDELTLLIQEVLSD